MTRTAKTTTEMLFGRHARTYIERLRRDPRTKAVFDGFIAQTMVETDQRFPILQSPEEAREAMHFATRRAVELAMAFVLDNDQEYQMVCAERDKARELAVSFAHTQPVVVGLRPIAEDEAE